MELVKLKRQAPELTSENKTKYSRQEHNPFPQEPRSELYMSLIRRGLVDLEFYLLQMDKKCGEIESISTPDDIFKISYQYLKSDLELMNKDINCRKKFINELEIIFSYFLTIIAEIGNNREAVETKNIQTKLKLITVNLDHDMETCCPFIYFECLSYIGKIPTLNEIEMLLSSLRMVIRKMNQILDHRQDFIKPCVNRSPFYKTRMCKYQERGIYCKGKDNGTCGYAHSADELRSLVQK